jgi:hypothetical protein
MGRDIDEMKTGSTSQQKFESDKEHTYRLTEEETLIFRDVIVISHSEK